ncbi:MAG: class I SAM-dependent methyltransferase [Alphaproteobacteria bacterium]|nr:MAG: class I SAM-dependent methyltransferase [Alphaproteobacteria bacterium]
MATRLDQVEVLAHALQRESARIDGEVTRIAAQTERSLADQERWLKFETARHRADVAGVARSLGEVTRRLDLLLLNRERLGLEDPAARQEGQLPATEGFEVFLDNFYHRLENRWRGAEEDIADRLRVYLPDVEAAVRRTGDKPVMDLGCGRGEWLGLLQEIGLSAFGVDTNAVQIDEARRSGLDAREGDAVSALAAAEDASLAVITAHHLVEHLPFETVAWITREAMRVLAPGGLLIYETPNTRNVLVGATTFHTDPTHLKPMPEQVLGVLFETAGFDPVEIRHLNPHERLEEFLSRPGFDPELAQLMFGPQDLALLGTRPVEG